jgi:hypothetical protein
MINYLFYSSRCESSNQFIRIIQNKGLQNMFNLLTIDTMPRDQLINLGIKFTPMIVIKDANSNSRYEGSRAFEWLENIIRFREQNLAKIAEENRRKLIQSNQTQTAVQNQAPILAHRPMETAGVSDSFSYVTDELQDMAQPKSFMPYGSDSEFKIITVNSNEGKLQAHELNTKLRDYKTKHEAQTNLINQSVENQLKQSLINNISNQNK